MTLTELIERLEAIRAEHGGEIIVMHHDDWDTFAVEKVEHIPPYSEDEGRYRIPDHVLITGDERYFDGEKNALTEPQT